MFDVVSIGGITEDIMFHTSEMQVLKNTRPGGSENLFAFEVGDKIVSDQDVLYTGGGGGANTAVSFARLGLKTALLGSLGDDSSAQKLTIKFNKEKINLSLLQVQKNYWTGLSFLIIGGSKNDRVIFSHRASNDRLKLNSANLAKIKTSWVYLSSLSGESWPINLKAIFDFIKKSKTKIAWNPGATQLKGGIKFVSQYLALTDVLILNKEEAEMLAGNFEIKKVAAKLLSYGPKIVAISDGAKGAYIKTAVDFIFEPALPLKAVNTTGAGDAFGSSLISGLLLYKNNLAKALKLALIRSSHVVAQTGAQEGLLTLSEVKKHYHF